jgi:DoxX-like family
MSSGRASTISLWVGRFISLIPVLLLLFSAFAKITQQPQVMSGFEKYGFADAAIRPLGITELACTILYLIPQTSMLGAILLTGYLGGATCTHIRAEESKFIVPVLLGVFVWLGLFFRDNRIRALIPFKKP